MKGREKKRNSVKMVLRAMIWLLVCAWLLVVEGEDEGEVPEWVEMGVGMEMEDGDGRFSRGWEALLEEAVRREVITEEQRGKLGLLMEERAKGWGEAESESYEYRGLIFVVWALGFLGISYCAFQFVLSDKFEEIHVLCVNSILYLLLLYGGREFCWSSKDSALFARIGEFLIAFSYAWIPITFFLVYYKGALSGSRNAARPRSLILLVLFFHSFERFVFTASLISLIFGSFYVILTNMAIIKLFVGVSLLLFTGVSTSCVPPKYFLVVIAASTILIWINFNIQENEFMLLSGCLGFVMYSAAFTSASKIMNESFYMYSTITFVLFVFSLLRSSVPLLLLAISALSFYNLLYWRKSNLHSKLPFFIHIATNLFYVYLSSKNNQDISLWYLYNGDFKDAVSIVSGISLFTSINGKTVVDKDRNGVETRMVFRERAHRMVLSLLVFLLSIPLDSYYFVIVGASGYIFDLIKVLILSNPDFRKGKSKNAIPVFIQTCLFILIVTYFEDTWFFLVGLIFLAICVFFTKAEDMAIYLSLNIIAFAQFLDDFYEGWMVFLGFLLLIKETPKFFTGKKKAIVSSLIAGVWLGVFFGRDHLHRFQSIASRIKTIVPGYLQGSLIYQSFLSTFGLIQSYVLHISPYLDYIILVILISTIFEFSNSIITTFILSIIKTFQNQFDDDLFMQDSKMNEVRLDTYFCRRRPDNSNEIALIFTGTTAKEFSFVGMAPSKFYLSLSPTIPLPINNPPIIHPDNIPTYMFQLPRASCYFYESPDHKEVKFLVLYNISNSRLDSTKVKFRHSTNENFTIRIIAKHEKKVILKIQCSGQNILNHYRQVDPFNRDVTEIQLLDGTRFIPFNNK
eukprot:TRINITY_DN27636_c0_g1_i1.p1 TRINITY_DN27636_c0_g1~~TRINITY_DN27636_c0_g1_i1.p1  ORF type:complete len:854 (+),score=133.76 TRINITY_DN27636_c0_g1_i1:117-2678(+)